MSTRAGPHARRPPIAITMGDAAGIGPEIIVRAFREAGPQLAGCFVAGDLQSLRRATRAQAGAGVPAWPIALIDSPQEAWRVPPRSLPLLQVTRAASHDIVLGRVDAEAGRMAGECVEWAARAALGGDIAAIVTAPLHKEALSAAGYAYPGHTELLQAEAARHLGCTPDQLPVRMMLANDELRTVLVSIHMSLRRAIDAVTRASVLETIAITHASLSRLLGRAPRIAVAGLNPHAGEGGLFGTEERESIGPAIEAARAQGMQASGPHAPDTVFMRARAGAFDVVVAMYHDQGLIPVKYLGVEKGVNVTLGLPLVRTSPDHGTAFDIAGRGVADASSLLAALAAARSLTAGADASAAPVSCA